MLALIQTIILAIDIYWWLVIGSAIFSWLYAFNVVNSRNQFVGMIGNFLYRVTELRSGPSGASCRISAASTSPDRAAADPVLPAPVSSSRRRAGPDLRIM